jgi:hypothetical protein
MGCNQIGLHLELHPLQCRSQFQNKSKKVHFLLCMVELQSVTHMCGLGHNLGHHVYHRWGVWNGAFCVFRIIGSRKKYSDSQCCWKNILILLEEKKKAVSEFLSYNLKIDCGKIFCALRDKKKILTLVLSKKKILNEKKTIACD